MHLGGARIIRYPWHTGQRPTCQIEMEVLRFEPNTRQEVELLADWALIDLSTKVPLVFKKSRIARQTGTKSMEASVAALSETLGDLSREIADTILARFRPTIDDASPVDWYSLVSFSSQTNHFSRNS